MFLFPFLHFFLTRDVATIMNSHLWKHYFIYEFFKFSHLCVLLQVFHNDGTHFIFNLQEREYLPILKMYFISKPRELMLVFFSEHWFLIILSWSPTNIEYVLKTFFIIWSSIVTVQMRIQHCWKHTAPSWKNSWGLVQCMNVWHSPLVQCSLHYETFKVVPGLVSCKHYLPHGS